MCSLQSFCQEDDDTRRMLRHRKEEQCGDRLQTDDASTEGIERFLVLPPEPSNPKIAAQEATS
ncbi:hypothetical protein KSF_088350 [Reticulibacter mediterranei]|uniref:Uncharacterized protein n=1 Tax=Reticulibacter mediterranei TaxID=2778369 RepID=A0A8J3IXV2_9CHLR|nr:hypothetical protein KSF_088350 [Reticulibacter mediterranei]